MKGIRLVRFSRMRNSAALLSELYLGRMVEFRMLQSISGRSTSNTPLKDIRRVWGVPRRTLEGGCDLAFGLNFKFLCFIISLVTLSSREMVISVGMSVKSRGSESEGEYMIWVVSEGL